MSKLVITAKTKRRANTDQLVIATKGAISSVALAWVIKNSVDIGRMKFGESFDRLLEKVLAGKESEES